ncbi:hypothetical protein [Fundicoccus ignavus]|uniref:hypothetical protein n=1 Tax=Fundicoccus ignavus TaxID=2664442 RepID=UPI001627F576|nr:hypothetical protein [Fundicoccus ignavus]
MEHEHFTGKVISQKIIQADNPTMILIKLMLDNDTEMLAIFARKALTFMLEVQVGDIISIYGHYNQRQQFIIEKYLIKQKMIQTNEQPFNYPKQKRYKNK